MTNIMFFTFLVGTAGSGKSHLTASLESMLAGRGLSVTTVNLDPGVTNPPYECDVDIRNYVDYNDIVGKFGLGPNGALVASIDMAVSYVADIKDEIHDANTEYVLVDCPGQMELFAYRNSGPLMVTSLSEAEPTLALYLVDSNIARTPEGYIAAMLLGVSMSIRFRLPQLSILSKPDILKEETVDEIVGWSAETYLLEEALGKSESGPIVEFSQAVARFLDELGGGASLLPVSAKTMRGMDELYGEMQRVFLGGDNLID